MKFNHLVSGRLLKRYKRFLADIVLEDGTEMTVHCPNTGSMARCAEPGSRVWIEKSPNPKRKYPYTWELVEVDQQFLCCINTHRANGLVAEAIESDVITELQGYQCLKREVKYHDNSRIDLFLSDSKTGAADAYVEVKNLTYLLSDAQRVEGGEDRRLGVFPDAVTTRGAKHLEALMAMKSEGFRAVLLFCVPHEGIEVASVADDIDPHYGRLLRQAIAHGVEVFCYAATISPTAITLTHPVLLKL